MNEMTAYLISRLDAIGAFVLVLMCIIPLIIGIIMTVVSVVEDGLTKSSKKTIRIIGISLLVFSLFGVMLKTCIPSTR